MKNRVAIALACLTLCGCNNATESEQLVFNKPIKIAESDGVTLWKVRDATPGGKSWVYYTTPGGRTVETE